MKVCIKVFYCLYVYVKLIKRYESLCGSNVFEKSYFIDCWLCRTIKQTAGIYVNKLTALLAVYFLVVSGSQYHVVCGRQMFLRNRNRNMKITTRSYHKEIGRHLWCLKRKISMNTSTLSNRTFQLNIKSFFWGGCLFVCLGLGGWLGWLFFLFLY